MNSNTFYEGFTLVELAIVLVIIGLIVGGVIQGRELIRQSEINKFIKDRTTYSTAISTFRLKYSALPGDFSRATTLISGSVGNGNNNGYIDSHIGYINGLSSNYSSSLEFYYIWNHLSVAKLISGSYNGQSLYGSCTTTTHGSGYCANYTPDVNVPKGIFDRSFYLIGNIAEAPGGQIQTQVSPAYTVSGTYGHSFVLLSLSTAGHWGTIAGIISSETAMEIDDKIDDGNANVGDLISNCFTSSTNGNYNLANTNNSCFLINRNFIK